MNWTAISLARFGQPLAGPQVERHAGPAPVVDEELEGDEGLGRRVGLHPFLAAVARHVSTPSRKPGPYWAADDVRVDVRARDRPEALEHGQLVVADDVGVQRPGGLHRRDAEQLEDVVLHHVAQGAGLLVVARARADPFLLGHGDLHVVDVLLVPERLEDRVAEPHDHQVLHRLLAEVMVDAEDLALVEDLGERGVEPRGHLRGRGRSASRR